MARPEVCSWRNNWQLLKPGGVVRNSMTNDTELRSLNQVWLTLATYDATLRFGTQFGSYLQTILFIVEDDPASFAKGSCTESCLQCRHRLGPAGTLACPYLTYASQTIAGNAAL